MPLDTRKAVYAVITFIVVGALVAFALRSFGAVSHGFAAIVVVLAITAAVYVHQKTGR